jgi:hypothetical protein
MKLFKSTLAAAAMLGTLAVTPAWADFNFSNVCGGNSFHTCASGSLATSVGGGVTVVTINVTFEGTQGELWKSVGLIGLPAGSSVAFTSGPAGYEAPPPNDLSGGGLPDDTFGSPCCTSPGNGQMLGNAGITSGTFVFTIQGELTQQQIDALGVGIHGISGPNGCSTKFGVTSSGAVNNTNPDEFERCSETVIPEPITMTLLATGLAGMGGVGFIRRRRREDELG